MYPYHLTLEINFDSSDDAKIIYETLKVETKVNISDRSFAEINLKSNKIFLVINAKDITALRAAITSYMRLLNAAISTYEKIQEAFYV